MLGNRMPSLFKIPKAKRFEFKPRYYNETKERLAEQERRVMWEMEYEKKLGANPELSLRKKINEKWGFTNRKEAQQKSNRRIIIIAIALFLLAYFLLIR